MASASPDSYEVRETANLAKVMGPDENSYTVSAKRIPMPDGIELAADFYQPDLPADRKPHGLIYVLCPYGRAGVMALINAKVFAGRGYMVLLVSCRGTAGSGGVFVAAMTEQADSQAVVKWMRQQPWYPGKFVTFGPSYMGYVQWALLRDPPEDLVASINLCSVYDNSLLVWTNGAYRMDRISWSYVVARQDEITSTGVSSILDPRKLMATIQATPIFEATEKFFEGRASYALDAMKTPNVDDPFWAQAKHRAALERVNVPLLLRSGWYDTLTVQTMAAYTRLRDRGIKVYLTVGSWTHSEACGTDAMPEVFDFLDEYVTGRKKDHRPLSVRAFVTGAEEWRSLPSWPPATQQRSFYLHGDRTIDEQPPAADSPPTSFTYDPHNPTPTVGGPLMARGGRVDDSVYASRPDVLVYTSPPLTQDVEIMGKPVVQLAHSTEVPSADLWIRLSEVDTDGVSHNLTENWQALDDFEQQDAQGGMFSLALVDRAHVFKKGTCIRVIVAGGSFPLIARNPGTGVNRTLAKELKAVTHTVQHGSGVSRLILPCSV
ncbi:galactose-binding domain-like protein [Lasiosphaeria ovina]|uniref:Galactose-binding domain-like protein n=1 Tax=Lasiosphaeria ovina TaxID=92902 RepID=A0AAE0NAT3_9PEZI|nr:galactose-binding domain-like protein [Lasiosphaeria ovina]